MLILWIHRKKSTQENKSDEATKPFSHHDDEMKKFRDSHPELEQPTTGDLITPDGQVLALVEGVKLPRNTQN